jgi:hypothetical protein
MDIKQIKTHFDNTIGKFVNGVMLLHPVFKGFINPKHYIYAVDVSSSFLVSGSRENELFVEINIKYGHIPADLIKPFKKAMNDYFRPFLKSEGVRHWLNCRNQRTCIYSVHADSSVLNVGDSSINLTNKDLEAAIRLLIESQK